MWQTFYKKVQAYKSQICYKKGSNETKTAKKKKRNRFQNKEDKYTESIQSKAVVEREIDSGLELTKEGTLKQFEDSENETPANDRV